MASSDAGVRPITSRSAAEQVTIELRRAILSGALAPGRKISLREIAEMLGVSFIPVRDALRDLESQGLVIAQRGRSAVVAPLDLDDLDAIYRLRRVLEPEIAGRSCELISDDELDRLEDVAAGFGDEARGMNAIYDDHHAFHLGLLVPAATAWDIRVLTTLWGAAERYVRIGIGRLDPDPHEHQRREAAHEDLIAAFRTRDPATVAGVALRHLDSNEYIARRALEEGSGDGD